MAVVLPGGPEGPRRLAAAGAARVLVLGGECHPEPGLEVWSGPLELTQLPLRDRSVDAIACIEGGVSLDPNARHALVQEARRVLREGGMLALGVEPDATSLWEVEDDLRAAFAHVVALAQLEWQGVSLAPLLPAPPDVALEPALREGLIDEPLPTQRYLLLASQEELVTPLRECIIVPTGPVAPLSPVIEVVEVTVASPPPPPPEPEPEPEPEPAENNDFDLVALFAAESASALLGVPTPRLHEPSTPETPPAPEPEPEPEHEAESEPMRAAPAGEPDPEMLAELLRLREIVDNFAKEREGLIAHAVKLAGELDRSREEKARTDAELHAARQRLESLQHVQEDSRLHSLAALMRRPDPETTLATHELVDEIAPLAGPESGRATADAAIDRNRLREELARRTGELQELETRVLQQEEEIRREHLENVRLVTDVDRLREQVERSRAIEQDRVQELERLGHELRKLEVDHAELQGLYNTQEQRLRAREESGAHGAASAADSAARRLELEKVTAQRDQLRARERAAADIVRRRDRELAEATRTVRELRRSVEDHATLAAQLRGELAVLQVHIQRLEETVPSLQERLREQQRKTIEREDEAADLQRRLEESVAEQEHLRSRLRRQRQDMEALAGAKQGAEVELFRLRRELEAKHQAIDQLQQIVSLGAGRMGQATGPLSDAARSELLALRSELADQAAEHAEALARSEAEHQRIVEHERARLRRSRLEAGIRAEEMEYLLFQLDTAEQKIWEMNDATDRSAARLAAGLAQLEKQKEQYEDLADELEVTRNLLVEAQAKIAELERLLDNERARLARVSLAPATLIDGPDTSGTFDVTVDEPDPESEELVAPPIHHYPGDPDPLAGIDLDDESEPVSLAVRLAGGAPGDSGDFDMPSLGSAEVSSPVFRLPSDDDVDLDDDMDNAPTRVVLVPDEEEDEVFSIDTEWGELDVGDDDRRSAASRAGYERDLSNQRIVIEVLEDEAWPADGELEPELAALLTVRPDPPAEDGKPAAPVAAEAGKADDKSS